MKTLIISALVVRTLIGPSSAPALESGSPGTIHSEQNETAALGWGWKTRRRSVEEVESFYRDFAINVLQMEKAEADAFVDLAWRTADLLGVDLQDGGAFVLILVLFILLVIIGAGFGLGC